MPSTSTRGFIVRPPQDNTEPVAEPEFDSVSVQVGSDCYSFTREEIAPASRWGIPVSIDTCSTGPFQSVQERIKDKMLEKIEEFLESNQLNELSLLVTTYEKFKELHP